MGGGLTPRRAGRLGDGVPGKPWKAMVVFDVFSHEVTKSGVFFPLKKFPLKQFKEIKSGNGRYHGRMGMMGITWNNIMGII